MSNRMPPEYYALHCLNPLAAHNSGSRGYMFSSHLMQSLQVIGASPARFQSGMDTKLSDHVFKISMPCDAIVLKIIRRYDTNSIVDRIPMNPEIIIIYENYKTKEISYISVTNYASYHQYFGFEYKFTDALNNLKEGMFVEKDTLLAHPRSLGENRSYNYSVELNLAIMSHPAVVEDGCLVRRGALKDLLAFKVYHKRVIEFGKKEIPLNLYGNLKTYKPFPEIGDKIHHSGILMALRKISEGNAAVEIGGMDLMTVDHLFDTCYYVKGPEGRVVDIKVIKNPVIYNGIPTGVMDYMEKYSKANVDFYRQLMDFKSRTEANRKTTIDNQLSPKFHALLVKAGVYTGKTNNKTGYIYKKKPIDQYRIEFTIEYTMIPTMGSKISDQQGAKGVVCQVEEDENMPVDANGRRADIVASEEAILNRMNFGRPYGHHFNDIVLTVEEKFLRMLDMPKIKKRDKALSELSKINSDVLENAFNYLLGFYECIDKNWANIVRTFSYEDKLEHISHIVASKLIVPVDMRSDEEFVEILMRAEKNYPTLLGPITYVGYSGRKVKTINNIRIAPIASILLNKIADTGSSVASCSTHHLGVVTPETKSSKHTFPYSASGTKTTGETEGRLWVSYAGREAAAEIIDRSNNPNTHQLIYETFLTHKTPTNVPVLIDRNKHKYNETKPLQLYRHISQVSGWRAVYVKESKFRVLTKPEPVYE